VLSICATIFCSVVCAWAAEATIAAIDDRATIFSIIAIGLGLKFLLCEAGEIGSLAHTLGGEIEAGDQMHPLGVFPGASIKPDHP
jgi:heme/copper-type cytochrome/quinol oxidase subunit 3